MPQEYSDADVQVSPKTYSDDEVSYKDLDVTIKQTPAKSLQELGATTKPETPGLTYLPSGVVHRAADNRYWVPSVKQWVPKEGNSLVLPKGAQPNEQEATDAYYLSQHMPESGPSVESMSQMAVSHKPLTPGAKPTEIIPGMQAGAISREASPFKEFGQQLYSHGVETAKRTTAGLLDIAAKAQFTPVPLPSVYMNQTNKDLSGAAKDIMQQVMDNPIPEAKTALGKTGAAIGGVAPHMTPLAVVTMAADMFENGYRNALDAGASEDVATQSGVAHGLIGATLAGVPRITKGMLPRLGPALSGYDKLYNALTKEVEFGGNGPVSKFLINLVNGSLKTGIDFAAMGAANDAIAEAAKPSGGSPLEAASNLQRRLDDIKTGALFHAVPAVIGAGVTGTKEFIKGKLEGKPEGVPAEAAPRTREQVLADMHDAMANGDTEAVVRLKAEHDAIAPEAATPTPEPTTRGQKIELDPTRRFGKIDLDVPEIAKGDIETPKSPEQIAAEAEMTKEAQAVPSQPEARAEVQKGLTEQADTIEAMRARRDQVKADLNSAEEQAKQATRTKGPEGRRIAEKTAQGLRDELATLDSRIEEHTGQPGGLTPEGSGTELLSNEEIQRQQRGDTYYRVDRSGKVTNLGPQPDAPVRNGEAIIMVDGATGKPQVQNSEGLGPDTAVLSRFGEKVSQVHRTSQIADNLGLQQLYEAGMSKAKEKLGLPETATDGEVVRGVMQQIGKLGTSVKETVVKIMSQVKGIGRDLAEAIANHLHEAVSGTKESQLGAIGPDIKAKHRADYGEALKLMYPGDTPEMKAARHEAWTKYKGPAEAVEPPVKPSGKATFKDVASETHVGKVFKDLQHTFGTGVGELGEKTKESIRELAARAELASAQRWEVLGKLKSPFEKLPVEDQHALIDAYESGKKIEGFGAWDKGSEWARDQYNKLWVEMQAEGIDSVGYLENYLTLMAKDKGKVGEYMGKMEKTLAGSAGFLKTREIANYKTLRAMGIEPEFTNMADIMTVSMANMERLIKAKRVLNAELKAGRVVALPGDQPNPEGMVPLDERMTRKIGDREVKEDGKPGGKLKYYAEPGVATIFNNHVSQGWEATPKGGNLYRWARTVADTSTAMQLAVNAFHFTFAMHDAAISTWSLGLGELQHGNIGKGLYDVAKAAIPGWSQADIFMDGRKLRKAMLENKVPDELKPLAEAFLMAGGRASSAEYRINALHTNASTAFRNAAESMKNKDFWRAIQQASSGVIKTPIRIGEFINKPLMEHLIPNMKVGVFAQLAAHEMAKGEANLRPRLQRAWQVTEDRLGQMTYDNLFWDNAARQLLHIGTRSVGWNLGTINVARGATDAVKSIAKTIQGKDPEWSHRANYVAATLMFSALNGMMIQYLTGNGGPKPLKNPNDEFLPGVPGSTDAFAPRTGGTDRFGRPNRTMPAGYVKDLAEFTRMAGGRANFVDYLSSKLNPAISGTWQAVRNRDSMGNEIGTVSQRVMSAIPQPISIGQVAKAREEGKSWPASLAPAVGFPEAKRDLVSTHAENILREKLNLRRAGQTQEAAEESMRLGRLAEAQHAGKGEMVQEELRKGEISRGQLKNIRARAKEQSFIKTNIKNRNLSFDDLYDVYKAADEDTKKVIKPELMKRYITELPKASPKRQIELKSKKADIK